jgi:hypothetical protein
MARKNAAGKEAFGCVFKRILYGSRMIQLLFAFIAFAATPERIGSLKGLLGLKLPEFGRISVSAAPLN